MYLFTSLLTYLISPPGDIAIRRFGVCVCVCVVCVGIVGVRTHAKIQVGVSDTPKMLTVNIRPTSH